jgi:hypothetical protein
MKSLARSTFAAVFCAAAGFGLPLAVTGPARAADDAMIEMARERFQEGVKYYDEKQYEKARAAFLQAYALKRHPAVLLNLAQSELRSGHEADAAKHFATYLREHKEASALEKQEAEKGLAAAKTKVGEVNVETDDGAELFVDGQPEGRTPLPTPLYLEPGQHAIEARKEGKAGTSNVTAKAGASTSINIALSTPAPAASPAAPAGEDGPSPAEGATAPTESDIAAESDTGGGAGTESEGRAPFFVWAKQNKVAWIGGAITLVGAGAGIAFAITSKSSYDGAEETAAEIRTAAAEDDLQVHPCSNPSANPRPQQYVNACTKYTDQVKAGDDRKTGAIISFVVAGAAAAGTIVYYLIDGTAPAEDAKKRPRTHNARLRGVAPVVGPGIQGIGLYGEF